MGSPRGVLNSVIPFLDRISVPSAHLSTSAHCLPEDPEDSRSGKSVRRDRRPLPVTLLNFRPRETGRRTPVCDPPRAVGVHPAMYNRRAARVSSGMNAEGVYACQVYVLRPLSNIRAFRGIY